jgi:hypothetical protein
MCAEERLTRVVIHDFIPEKSDNPKVDFKLKIRLVLKNNAGIGITVEDPDWDPGADGVTRQNSRKLKGTIQVEGARGWRNNDWKGGSEGVERAGVAPGEVFRTWVGLNQSFGADDVRRLHEVRKLGTIIVPVSIDGHNINWEGRL